MPQMMRAGVWLNLCGILVITALVWLFIIPLLGNAYTERAEPKQIPGTGTQD